MELVQRTGMIVVRVRQNNANYGQTKLLRGLDNWFGATFQCGVDQGEAILFAYQIHVDTTKVSELEQVVPMCSNFHPFVLSFIIVRFNRMRKRRWIPVSVRLTGQSYRIR